MACVVGRGGAGGNGATVGAGGGVAVVLEADGVVLLDVDDGVSSITVSFLVQAGRSNALAIATHAITVLVIVPLSSEQGPTCRSVQPTPSFQREAHDCGIQAG